MLLKEKTAVITGCNRGIGKATLKLFAEHGADVWACVRQVDDEFAAFLDALRKETGRVITPVCFDLADEDGVKAGAKEILAEKKPIDILVNNAGIIHTSLFQMTPVDKMKELFEVNYFSQLLLTQYMIKTMMRKRSGAIVNISSSAAIEGNEGRTAYASSKAAMICSTKVMAKELARANIRVNAIAPGLTMTDMMTGSTPEDALEQTLERICMKRVGEPEEIAKAALFLSSDLASYMTGQVLRVDEGM